MNEPESFQRIRSTGMPESFNRQARTSKGLNDRQADSSRAAVADQMRDGNDSTDKPQDSAGEHHAPSVASVHGPHPTHAMAARRHGYGFTTRDCPVTSGRDWSAAPVRYGVSTIRSGERNTLALVFHDAG